MFAFLITLVLLSCNLLTGGIAQQTAPIATEIRPNSPDTPSRQPELGEVGSFVFEPSECDYPRLPLEVECGYLNVPADHHNPDSGQILLAVAILKAPSPNPEPDPVVYLEGGPGGGATANLEDWLGQPFLRNRDLILVDQRGAGASQPSLNCPEMEGNAYEIGADNDDALQAARACRQRLESEGIDTSLFTSAQSAADLNALRLAMGYEQWNLLGVSYGTRLALTTLRDYPQGIRSATLDSVYPPQVNAYEEQAVNGASAVQALFKGCARDPKCNHAYPDLENVFNELLDELDENPVDVTLDDPGTGDEIDFHLDGVELANYIFDAMYDIESFPVIPYVIYEVYYGNYEALLELESSGNGYARQRQDEADLDDSEGLYYAVECGEELPFNNLNIAEDAALAYASPMAGYLFDDVALTFAACRAWGMGAPNQIESQPVQSTIPTLVLAGEYDPITPPDWGQQAADYLRKSYFFVFPGVGHSVIDSGKCARRILAEFLDTPEREPNAFCIRRMPGVDFHLP